MDVARQIGAAHEYLELDRDDAQEQWRAFKTANPYGFDAVVGVISFDFFMKHIWILVGRNHWQH